MHRHQLMIVAAALMAVGPLSSTSADAQSSDLSTHLSATIDGEKVQGDVVARGREGTIECTTMGFDVYRPSSATGTVKTSSATAYSPISCTTAFDATTIQFWRALTLGLEVEASFDFFQQDSRGVAAHVFAIRISRGRVKSVRVMPESQTVELQFEFVDVVMSHTPSGMEHADRL